MPPASLPSTVPGVPTDGAWAARGGRPRRWPWLIGLAALAGLGWLASDRLLVDRRPIVVGLLHSQTGPMAVSEKSMIDAEVLALEEINAGGGILGRPVRWVIADGASDPPTFARQAEKLIRDDHAAVVFGCWTSASRKSVLPVVEAADHLLVYPMAYEGLEQSPNVVYTGAAPNQQITPAVQWCHNTLGARRFFLVGSDYIWPHCVNAIISDQLAGLGAERVGEAYIPYGSTAVDAAVREIVAARPDVVLSAVVGDSALAFARALRAAGVRPEEMPVVTFSVAEDELRTGAREDFAGHYAAWNYFQSIDRPENQSFVRSFKARYGGDRTTSDVIAAAYDSVRLWAQAVREAGTTEVHQVRNALRFQSLDAPEGIISIDAITQHTWRPVSIGRIRPDGQFDIVWTSRTAVRPVPFPLSRSREAWEEFVADLQRRWGGSWVNTAGIDAPGRPAPPPAP
ncbi:MAG: urea ABC transporter substrate-binding protein [Planctomycetia bacterium]|nr:urea ABC transporter substrate-binding protein [Planctomycetia bacterium]